MWAATGLLLGGVACVAARGVWMAAGFLFLAFVPATIIDAVRHDTGRAEARREMCDGIPRR